MSNSIHRVQISLRSLIRSISLELYVNEYRTRRSYSRRVLFFYFSMYETFYIVNCLYAGHRSTIKNMFLLNLSKSIIVYYFLKVRNLYQVISKCCYRIQENLLISLISDLKRSLNVTISYRKERYFNRGFYYSYKFWNNVSIYRE